MPTTKPKLIPVKAPSLETDETALERLSGLSVYIADQLLMLREAIARRDGVAAHRAFAEIEGWAQVGKEIIGSLLSADGKRSLYTAEDLS
jgi:hypothetical protein